MEHATDSTPAVPSRKSREDVPPQWAIDAAREYYQSQYVAPFIDKAEWVTTNTPALAAIIAKHAPTAEMDKSSTELLAQRNELQSRLDDRNTRIATLEAENAQLKTGVAKLIVSSLSAQGRELSELKADPILARHYPSEVYGAKLLGEM